MCSHYMLINISYFDLSTFLLFISINNNIYVQGNCFQAFARFAIVIALKFNSFSFSSKINFFTMKCLSVSSHSAQDG